MINAIVTVGYRDEEGVEFLCSDCFKSSLSPKIIEPIITADVYDHVEWCVACNKPLPLNMSEAGEAHVATLIWEILERVRKQEDLSDDYLLLQTYRPIAKKIFMEVQDETL